MKFDNIDIENEMVKKITKASYEIFALYDYKKASTNMIVKKAGVSRGILYHYFKDKEELFNYLNYYSFEKSFEGVNEHIDWENNDLIKRISELTKYRIDIIAEYPYMIEFGEKYRKEIFKFVEIDTLYKWREKLYKHSIDYSLFKNDLKIDKVLHVIKWTFRGLYKELIKNREDDIQDVEILNIKKECDIYYKLLTSNFYE